MTSINEKPASGCRTRTDTLLFALISSIDRRQFPGAQQPGHAEDRDGAARFGLAGLADEYRSVAWIAVRVDERAIAGEHVRGGAVEIDSRGVAKQIGRVRGPGKLDEFHAVGQLTVEDECLRRVGIHPLDLDVVCRRVEGDLEVAALGAGAALAALRARSAPRGWCCSPWRARSCRRRWEQRCR